MIRISLPTIWTNEPFRSDQQGFTLIELLVVVALIGLITIVALPSITNYFKLSLGTASREMASTVKEAYNSAVMTGRVYRVVYSFKEGSYWVESGPSTLLLDTAESREREEHRKKWAKPDDVPPPSGFAMDASVTRNKMSLPRGVVFEDIITQQSKDPLTEGLAYTHLFPHGVTEQTIIHLKDGSDHHVSLIISPLVGRTHVIERYVKQDESNDR